MIRALVVDDERYARKGIRDLLAKERGVELAGEAESGREAVEQIVRLVPDLVFLDIQMPGMDGFGVLENLPDGAAPLTIFVTAYDKYAVRAFEACALDYLLKPVKEARFRQSMERAREQLLQRGPAELGERFAQLLDAYRELSAEPASPWLERIAVKTRRGQEFIHSRDIDWIEAQDYYVALHVGARSYLAKASMTMLERKLDPRSFVRVHRSTIVNLDALKCVELTGEHGRQVVLRDGTRRRVSRSGWNQLQSVAVHLG